MKTDAYTHPRARAHTHVHAHTHSGTTNVEVIPESSPEVIHNIQEFLFFHIRVTPKERNKNSNPFFLNTEYTLIILTEIKPQFSNLSL